MPSNKSSNKFLTLAHHIAQRNKNLFDTLLEFEKTHKLRTKTRLNFTINKRIASDFRKYCRNQGYSMSAKVEQALQKIMKEKQ